MQPTDAFLCPFLSLLVTDVFGNFISLRHFTFAKNSKLTTQNSLEHGFLFEQLLLSFFFNFAIDSFTTVTLGEPNYSTTADDNHSTDRNCFVEKASMNYSWILFFVYFFYQQFFFSSLIISNRNRTHEIDYNIAHRGDHMKYNESKTTLHIAVCQVKVIISTLPGAIAVWFVLLFVWFGFFFFQFLCGCISDMLFSTFTHLCIALSIANWIVISRSIEATKASNRNLFRKFRGNKMRNWFLNQTRSSPNIFDINSHINSCFFDFVWHNVFCFWWFLFLMHDYCCDKTLKSFKLLRFWSSFCF